METVQTSKLLQSILVTIVGMGIANVVAAGFDGTLKRVLQIIGIAIIVSGVAMVAVYRRKGEK